MHNRALVVDANILVRAVLGKRVREIIEKYAGSVSFFVPRSAYNEAEKHLTTLTIKHGGNPQKALALLHSLGRMMELIGSEIYGEFEAEARERLGGAILRIGPCWRLRSFCIVRSGLRIQISSVVE